MQTSLLWLIKYFLTEVKAYAAPHGIIFNLPKETVIKLKRLDYTLLN
jgi:hypothetical protein